MATLYPALMCFVLASMVVCGLASSSCNNVDPRCPCLRLTYKMTTYEKKKTCFQFYFGVKTWKESNDYCRQQGGRLVMLNDRETFQFVRSTLNSMSWNAEKVWIGAHDIVKELKWMWTNKRGEPDVPVTFTFWTSGNPESWFHSYKDCVLMKKDNGQWKWHEAMCHMSPFEYKFICEYDMKNVTVDTNNANGVGGVIQHSSHDPTNPTSLPPTDDDSVDPIYDSTRHKNNHGTPPRGDNRKVTDSDNLYNHLEGQGAKAAESEEEEKDKHVPMYVVIIAFACGSAFALFIVLFFVLRRRKRRKDDGAYPSVEYHAHPAHTEPDSSTLVLAGAVGGVGGPRCVNTGKLCKVAVDVGAEACACSVEVQDQCHRPKGALPNLYVSVDEVAPRHMQRSASDTDGSAMAVARMDSGLDSSISTVNNVEAPPTYDEACLDILADHITAHVVDAAYENEDMAIAAAPGQPSGGAKPKTPKKNVTPAPVPDYMPMTGSGSNSPASSQRNSRTSETSSQRNSRTSDTSSMHSQKDTSQYIPMDRGELPPIPTDDGYEIPVSRRLPAESERQARVSLIRPDSITSPEQSIYAEIPDRASRCLSNEDDERIYSSID